MTQKAVALFERPLREANHGDEKVRFAETTIWNIQAKLEAMRQSIGQKCLTTFDYNERLLVTQAVRLYMLELSLKPPDEHWARELRQCRTLIGYFSKGLEHVLG